MNKNTGGPAFPEIRIVSGDNYNPPKKLYYGGMTMRDYFAAKAMQGLLADPVPLEKLDGDNTIADTYAIEAYAYADAMLKARGE